MGTLGDMAPQEAFAGMQDVLAELAAASGVQQPTLRQLASELSHLVL